MMKRFSAYLLMFIFFISLGSHNVINNPKKVRILLMGDSTTEGGKPVFEESIEQIINNNKGIPKVEIINVGKGGETAYSLINSGRYDREISGIKDIDYIFFRYGINDWIHRKPFEEKFPADMKRALDQLRIDFPNSQIIIMTIIPFINESGTQIINGFIKQIAKEEELELFDIYPAYQKKMEEFGERSMQIRFISLKDIPENYHDLVAPYTKYYEWKKEEWVRVKTSELDPIFGHLSGWYKDKHPNIMGYRFLADQTARFLIPKLKN